jgi:hypothetical protein
MIGLLLTAFVACSRQQASKDAAADANAPAATSAPESPPVGNMSGMVVTKAAGPSNTTTVASQLTSSAATYTDAQRKFIRTAHGEFRVKDVYQSSLAIEDIAAAQGGFVVSNDIRAQTLSVARHPVGDGKLLELAEYTLRGTLVVRVPSDRTQPFLRAIVGQIDFLDQRRFEATDAQFDLLRQQLAYQRGQEAQQEIGQAEQQGGKLDQKTEALQGRDTARAARDDALIAQKEFEDKVAFSTIDLSMYQAPKVRQTELIDVQAVFRNNGPGFFPRLASSMRRGWYGLLDVVVALASLWPLWLLVAGTFVLAGSFRKKRASSRPLETKEQ